MQEARSFAYSLSQGEQGWSWSVYDEDGITVARGADTSRDGAQAAVNRMLTPTAQMDEGGFRAF